MDQKTIIAIIVFFAVLVAGMFTFAYLKKAEVDEAMPVNEEIAPQNDMAYPSIDRIETTHYYIDGVHTLVGEIAMPTPCDLLEADLQIEESEPPQGVINFTVINNSEFCAQQITPQRFMVSAEGPASTTFRATLMGRDVELNVIPAPPGETPEDFEVFIKG